MFRPGIQLDHLGNGQIVNKKVDISVVVPAYGSEQILPELVRRIWQVAQMDKTQTWELIIVCDNSPDNSWSVLLQLKAEYNFLRIRKLAKNFGQHNAILCGLEVVRGQSIVTMDDDLQHDPADIPKLIGGLNIDCEVVYAKFPSRKHPVWKILGSKFNNAVATRILDKPKSLYLSPFRAFNSRISRELCEFKGPSAYLDGLILQATRKIRMIEVSHHPRLEGESLYNLRKSFRLWWHMVSNGSILPLRIATAGGLIISVASMLAGILFVIQKFTIDIMPVGWSSIVISLMFLSGVQLFALGVIGEYLGKVSQTIAGKRQYSVDQEAI